MAEHAMFSLAFEIPSADQDRRAAFALYEEAFGARKISEFSPPGPDADNLHIMMEIGGIEILLHPNKQAHAESVICCQMHFDDDAAVHRAYNALAREGSDCSIGSWPHAPLSALVTDKYGVKWWLHT